MVQNKDKIVSDLKSGVDDAEGFLRAAASSTGDKAAELREKASVALKRASESLSDLQATVMEKSRDAAIHDRRLRAREPVAGHRNRRCDRLPGRRGGGSAAERRRGVDRSVRTVSSAALSAVTYLPDSRR